MQDAAAPTKRTQKIVSRCDSAKVLFECEVPDIVAAGMEMRHALEKATAAKASLSSADLIGADLRSANLRGANLSDADLIGANLIGADLRDATLIGANLSDADLSGANLIGANLRSADLIGANLIGADLRDANLRGADMRSANLSGANLRSANGESLRATPEQAIESLDKVRAIILDDHARLEMHHWHGGDQWQERTCAEEATCGTTHCLAGWLQVCSTSPESGA